MKLFSSLEIDYPDYFGGYYGIATIYQKEKNTSKATEYYTKTIKHCTDKQRWASEHSAKMIKQFSE